MAWVKMDDKRAMNKKLRAAGFEARGLDEAAICWCAHEETDGFLSDADLLLLASLHGCSPQRAKTLAAKLCSPDVKRWIRDERRCGYHLLGFLEFNPSHAELESARKKDRERKRRRHGSDGDSTVDSARIPVGSGSES